MRELTREAVYAECKKKVGTDLMRAVHEICELWPGSKAVVMQYIIDWTWNKPIDEKPKEAI